MPGVPREYTVFICCEDGSRIIRFGGYARQGLTAAHPAGRIVSDLFLHWLSARAALQSARRPSRTQVPEPRGYIEANSVYTF